MATHKTVKHCTFAVVVLYDRMNDDTGFFDPRHGYIRFWGHLEEEALVSWRGSPAGHAFIEELGLVERATARGAEAQEIDDMNDFVVKMWHAYDEWVPDLSDMTTPTLLEAGDIAFEP